MDADRFDLVVIGGGAAGEKGAAQAAYFGKRVAVVERRAEPGGATVHTGTLPSKTLREAALFLSGYRQRDLYGVSVEVDPRPRGRQAHRAEERRPRARDRPDARRTSSATAWSSCTATARLIDAVTVEVDGRARAFAARSSPT